MRRALKRAALIGTLLVSGCPARYSARTPCPKSCVIRTDDYTEYRSGSIDLRARLPDDLRPAHDFALDETAEFVGRRADRRNCFEGDSIAKIRRREHAQHFAV